MTPAVSILLPVRDGAEHLDEAMASLMGQTFEDFEVVAVDDGSTDDTPRLLQAWADRDRRIRVLRQEPTGIVAALERARSAARGVYVARMDADDIAEPSRLEAQHRLLQDDPSLAGCGCRVRYFPRSRVRAGARRYEAWMNRAVTPRQIERAIFVECPLAHPTFFLRAEALDAVGGYRDFPGPEDYDLILRLWARGHRLGKVPEVLLRWRESDERLSRIDPRYAPDAFLAVKLHYLRSTLLSDGRSVVVWGAGPVGKRWSRALRARGVGLAAFVEVDARKIGQEIHGAPVLGAEDGVAVDGALHLAAVGQEGARARIVGALEEAGRHPMTDFVAVA